MLDLRTTNSALTRCRLNLALQGGGVHGAFTWGGVLDRLLEDDRLSFDGVSGTSAGAMNAVVMAHGLVRAGRDGARAALAEFWLTAAARSPVTADSNGALSTRLTNTMGWARWLSPRQWNLFDLDRIHLALWSCR